ncbi:MAG: pentapeptide repeat-containing protein [bacterium]|nr:pentapeptide repeat-containing protein [bacterium]
MNEKLRSNIEQHYTKITTTCVIIGITAAVIYDFYPRAFVLAYFLGVISAVTAMLSYFILHAPHGSRIEYEEHVETASSMAEDLALVPITVATGVIRTASIRALEWMEVPIRAADFRTASLRWADLTTGSLSVPAFRTASLRGAALATASLREVALATASLRGAALATASLREAALATASLRAAALATASLRAAALTSASFRAAAGLTTVSFRAAGLTTASFRAAEESSLEDVQSHSLSGAGLEAQEASEEIYPKQARRRRFSRGTVHPDFFQLYSDATSKYMSGGIDILESRMLDLSEKERIKILEAS